MSQGVRTQGTTPITKHVGITSELEGIVGHGCCLGINDRNTRTFTGQHWDDANLRAKCDALNEPGALVVPEYELLSAMLMVAIEDLKATKSKCEHCHNMATCPNRIEMYYLNKHGNTPYLKHNPRCNLRHTKAQCARTWFASDNTEERSFLWLCEQLELNPNRLRKELGLGL